VVALKVSSPNARRQAALRREFDVLRDMGQHPSDLVPRAFRLTCVNQVVAYAMEYIPWTTMEDALQRIAASDQVERLALAILHSVAYVHSLGYAHGDLKPNNILVSPGLTAIKLVDFGLTREAPALPLPCSVTTTDAQRFHALSYRAPEMILWRRNSQAADMWAVGCLLVQMLSGNRLRLGPFHTDFGPLQAKRLPRHEEVVHEELLQLRVLLSRLGHPGRAFFHECAPFVEPLHRNEWGRMEAEVPSPVARPGRLQRIRERTRSDAVLGVSPPIQIERILELVTDLLQWCPRQRSTAAQAIAYLEAVPGHA
jgi:serine/threonine protein kinase